jgi:hypothetical protein
MKWAFLLLIGTLPPAPAGRASVTPTSVRQQPPGFAVVELFTSEGCSSCPPADEVAARLRDAKKNVFILAYHVDYWDRLGWKDPFSNSFSSKRQQDYAAALGLNNIYTPQMVVNGETEFVGSDETRLLQTVDRDLRQSDPVSLSLRAAQDPGNQIRVTCSTESSENLSLQVALVQDHAETNVHRGENAGKLLHHVNIVRDLKTVSMFRGSSTLSFQLPSGISAADCRVIAFLQENQHGRIRGAAATAIP